jgi:hypothetical protein
MIHVSTTTAAAFGKCHDPYLSIGGGKKGSTEKPNQPQNANSWVPMLLLLLTHVSGK